MKILSNINSTYRSPALATGNTVHKWSIAVTCKFKFNHKEMNKLGGFNFDIITKPLTYNIYDGGGELELINSEIIDSLPEHEIDQKIDYLRKELKAKVNEVKEHLIKEFDFEVEEVEA